MGAEPCGILNWTGVTITPLNALAGQNPTYDNIIDAVTRRRAANEEPNGIAWHPTVAGYVSKLKDGDGKYLVPPPSVAALQREESSQIPTNLTHGTSTGVCSEIYVADWRMLLIGMRTNLIIEASRQAAQGSTSSAFADLQLWLRAYMRADVVLARDSAAEVLTGVTTS